MTPEQERMAELEDQIETLKEELASRDESLQNLARYAATPTDQNFNTRMSGVAVPIRNALRRLYYEAFRATRCMAGLKENTRRAARSKRGRKRKETTRDEVRSRR